MTGTGKSQELMYSNPPRIFSENARVDLYVKYIPVNYEPSQIPLKETELYFLNIVIRIRKYGAGSCKMNI